jgi:hypothetical protein
LASMVGGTVVRVKPILLVQDLVHGHAERAHHAQVGQSSGHHQRASAALDDEDQDNPTMIRKGRNDSIAHSRPTPHR